jgi:hypothetical protein
MHAQRINWGSTIGLIVLALTALLAVLSGYMSGVTQPPQTDEGVAAHIFQLSVGALMPMGFLFLATADWTQPVPTVWRLAVPAAVMVLAFAALHYLESVYLPAHGYPLPRPGLPYRLVRQLLTAIGQ